MIPNVEILTDILIAKEILVNQKSLVTELLDRGFIQWTEVEGLYNEHNKEREIYQWWVVSEWVADKLREQGEPVLRTAYGRWWGRTCTGQAIKYDGTIQRIIMSLE